MKVGLRLASARGACRDAYRQAFSRLDGAQRAGSFGRTELHSSRNRGWFWSEREEGGLIPAHLDIGRR